MKKSEPAFSSTNKKKKRAFLGNEAGSSDSLQSSVLITHRRNLIECT